MPDIFHDFPIHAPAERVFEAVSTPAGLDCWWTRRCTGKAVEGAEFELWFGRNYDWRANVTACVKNSLFELQMTRSDPDWTGTRIGFRLEDRVGSTNVQFFHRGWPSPNEHWRISCYCWAMYLRILRRYLEYGELVPYEKRLDV